MTTTAPLAPAKRILAWTATLLGLVLVTMLLGSTAPASAATTPAAAKSTANVGSALGWAQDTVYVENHASTRWNVKTAAERVSAKSALDLVVVTTCPARTSAAQAPVQCIKVSSADLGGGTLAGNTKWTFNKSTNKLTTATVVYNDRWAKTASTADKLNIAEHELGHAVGLAHVKRTSSVMDAVAHGKTSPDKSDIAELNKRY